MASSVVGKVEVLSGASIFSGSGSILAQILMQLMSILILFFDRCIAKAYNELP
jgi:hypothetical protein